MREKIPLPALVLVACVAAGILYWRLIFVPVEAEISAMRLETRRLEVQLRELEEFKARWGDLEEAVAASEERLALMREYLPPEMDSEKFLSTVYALADARKIFINSVQAGEISGDTVQRQTIKIRFEGRYIPLLNFIREILDGGRLARLDGYTIQRDGNILTGELNFSIFAAKT